MNAASVALAAWHAPLLERWRSLPERERRLVAVAITVVTLALLWWLAIQPAWRAVNDAPAQIDQLESQLQQMQRQAADARLLRATPPVARAQAEAALKSATAALGDAGRLQLSADRATLTLTNASGEQLRSWLAQARSAARARPVEAQLTRGARGYSGTLVLTLAGAL